MVNYPTDPTTLRAEARDIEIGAPDGDGYAGWLRACADRIEALENSPGVAKITTDIHCCICGKVCSTSEDGGPECQLSRGDWVCSSDCYYKAVPDPIKPEPMRCAECDCENGGGDD